MKIIKTREIMILFTLFCFSAVSYSATSEICSDNKSLEELVDCIQKYMPMSLHSFTKPDTVDVNNWRNIIKQMLEGRCSSALLSSSLSENYAIQNFYDQENGKTYCVLMETTVSHRDSKAKLGWGTFIVNSRYKRNINITIPHTLYDTGTAEQGIRIFKGADAHSFLMSGIYRYASKIDSTCQGPGNYGYPETDEAHNTDHVFHATIHELKTYYEAKKIKDYVSIQLHGLATKTCPGIDAFMTNGVSYKMSKSSLIFQFRENMKTTNSNWLVTLPGESPFCNMNGGSNVQGRLLNNVEPSKVCTEDPMSSTGKFIHIEQHWSSRDLSNVKYWIDGIKTTFPENK